MFVLGLIDAESMMNKGSEGKFLLGCIIIEASLELRLELRKEKIRADRVIQNSETSTDCREVRGKIASRSSLSDKMQLGSEVRNVIHISINCS